MSKTGIFQKRSKDSATPSQKKLRQAHRQINLDRRKAIIARTAAGRAAITAFIGKTKRNTKLPVIVKVEVPPPVEPPPAPPPAIAPPVAFDIFEFEKNPPKRVLPPLSAPVAKRVPLLVEVPTVLTRVHEQLKASAKAS